MSANTLYLVRVVKTCEDRILVSAIDTEEAYTKARSEEGVAAVLSAEPYNEVYREKLNG